MLAVVTRLPLQDRRGRACSSSPTRSWIRELGIHYKLGVDGLNLFLILLATVLFLASAIWASFTEWERPGLFFFWFGLAESGVLGALMAQDLALFVIFFDLMLVPFLFLTGSVGRRRAACRRSSSCSSTRSSARC